MNDFTVRSATTDDIPAVRAFMLRIFEQDYGHGYRPQWHWDYDDIQGVYLDNPRHALLLAIDAASGEIIGTGGLRSGGPRSTTLPAWLLARYQPPEQTAQIVRVFTHPKHRRRGIARRLTEELRRLARDIGGYERICLHSDTAVEFWGRMDTTVIYDDRTGSPPQGTVHFEFALPAR